MRRDQQARQVAGELARGGRLGVQHVERGGPDPPGPQRLDDRAGIDQAAARGVDQHRGGLHHGQFRGADQASRLRRQRGMQRNRVAPAEQVGQGQQRRQARPRPEERIVRHHLAAERGEIPGQAPGDLAEPDQADPLGGQPPDRPQPLQPPAAGGDQRARLGQAAGQRQQQAQGMHRDLLHAVVGHVGDDHAPAGGGRQVHVVNPDPVPGHDLAGGQLAEQLAGDGQVGIEQRVGVPAEAGDTARRCRRRPRSGRRSRPAAGSRCRCWGTPGRSRPL